MSNAGNYPNKLTTVDELVVARSHNGLYYSDGKPLELLIPTACCGTHAVGSLPLVSNAKAGFELVIILPQSPKMLQACAATSLPFKIHV